MLHLRPVTQQGVRIEWSADQDRIIRDMRRAGSTWESISLAIGVCRFTTIERGRKIGAKGPPEVERRIGWRRADEGPEPLRAGHPVSWGVIAAGGYGVVK